MSYMALYRKWRPGEFDEVKGQEHIVTTLKNQIVNDRIGHAYLFCGTRGTGKTTIAKLLAKAVNCEHPIDGSPCNECASCIAIAKQRALNVIEIDAASNNGVDNIRQINESVQYSPSQGKYLVYIIDEVHMLSTGAFNALLKTLEEPPSYVIFILATTEAHKIPITILSRCQKYDFRRISIETISDRLMDLLEREDIKATKEAVDYIAKAADGSMRDGLSILDQCISFNLGEELTYDKVLETIGAVDIEVYLKLLNTIAEEDIVNAINVIDEVIWSGRELTQFILDFMNFIRNVLMVKMSKGMTQVVDLSKDKIEQLLDISNKFDEQTLIRYINVLQQAANDVKSASMKRIVLEVAIVKMFKPEMAKSEFDERLKSAEKRLERVEVKSSQVVYVDKLVDSSHNSNEETNQSNGQQMTREETGKSLNDKLKAQFKPAEHRELMIIIKSWNEIVSDIMPITKGYLDQAILTVGSRPSSLELLIENTPDNHTAIFHLEREDFQQLLMDKLKVSTNRDISLSVRKVNSKDMKDKNLKQFDLSMINFDNIKYED